MKINLLGRSNRSEFWGTIILLPEVFCDAVSELRKPTNLLLMLLLPLLLVGSAVLRNPLLFVHVRVIKIFKGPSR